MKQKHKIGFSARFLRKTLLIALLSLCLTPAAHAGLESNVETVNCDMIKGWAWDSAQPTTRLKVDIIDITNAAKPVKLAVLTANTLRTDLLNAHKGDGKYGFTLVFPASIRNAQTHQFAVRLSGTTTELTHSPKVTAACYPKLNDTGVRTCSDNGNRNLACPVIGYAGQDGDYGRDARARKNQLVKAGAGSAGFDFTKIANDGSKLPATAVLGTGAKDWACTLDNVTGWVWEVKTSDGGLRDMSNTFSWYSTDTTNNGGAAGYQNYGSCAGGISCDTDGYVKKINSVSLCGKKDWRLPSRSELLSIVDYSRDYPYPTIDTAYFPNTPKDWPRTMFWSSSPYAAGSYYAWFVRFEEGNAGGTLKREYYGVRLVRGGQ